MKCSKCGAEVYEDIKKCPFCKTIISGNEDKKFKNFDFTYTITSDEQIKIIRDSVNEVAEKTAKETDAEKRVVLQSYVRRKKAATDKPKKRKFNKFKPFIALAVIVALLVALIVGVCSAIGAMFKNDDIAEVYSYLKGNTLYMVFNGEVTELSNQAISEDYLVKLETYTDFELINTSTLKKDLVKKSKDGRFVYYFENYDPETNTGDLRLIKDGKKKKIEEIADAVHDSLVIAESGERVLYLQSTNKNGDMGVLFYWEVGMDAPFKLATDIDHETYVFSANETKALYLQNLNRVDMQGDLYVKDIEKLKEEKVKLDTGVCGIYGTNAKEKVYIYGKNYDKSDATFDIYAMNKKGETLRLGERTRRAPIVLKKQNSAFVFGATETNMHNLYSVNIDSGEKEKIAADVNLVLRISDDEKTIIYDKIYDGKVSDYFIYTKGKQVQKFAENITIEGRNTLTAPQAALKDDYSKIAYISGFDSVRGGGVLYTCEYKNGKVSDKKMIAEGVYSCYRTKNDEIIFAKDYSRTRKVFDIYLYSGNDIRLLKEEVYPEMFAMEKNGDNIFYITEYNVSGPHGRLEKMNVNGKTEQLATGVFSFEMTQKGNVLVNSNLNADNGNFDLYVIEKNKTECIEVDKGINALLN